MGQKMVVLEGKTFSIELQSMLGSSGYGWCLSGLPKGIILLGEDRIATGPAVSSTLQKFYFGVSSAEEAEGELTFAMACTFEPTRVEREYKVALSIIPSNSDEFVSYSENANELYGFAGNQANACNTMNSAIPYGVLPPWERAPKFPLVTAYGLPQPTISCMDYGYPCGVQDAWVDYTNNGGAQDAGMKYGYFCGVQDAVMKYGYPCGMQSVINEPFISKRRHPNG
ncbi:MAG: hypothetical protein K2H52_17355 [Lachnospiraceae bacterium]|nr:hypothetical protein [Lachnospiraceae bacterium]MDE6184181.1 hypothetical protein [Lachnospiraceae bacterium]MDE7285713.1 hypothetical protein [Lachnospiraceae bacterium]